MRTFFPNSLRNALQYPADQAIASRCLLVLAGKQTIEKTASGARWLDINSQI